MKCLQDIDCVAENLTWGSEADVYCSDHIEDYARYSHEWTDGFGEKKFNRVIIMPPDYLTVKFVGDKVRFQNGFGAWQRMRYTCVYDPLNNSVVEVEVWPRG